MTTTKELARKLGLLRRRAVPNENVQTSKKRSRSTRQTFAYLVVLDYESTCWDNDKFRTQEIIEFPAVLLNTINGNIESEFQFYVQPQEQPILSDFCKQLTGITQEQVDNGIPLPLCLKKFCRWLDKLHEEKNIVFQPPSDGSVPYATFVTWSDWDLGTCLLNECKRKQILRPLQLNSWIDLRATYRKFYSRKPAGLNGALQDVGIQFEGREHSGLHDARNTARLAWRMICDGCEMKITKNIKRGTGPQLITSAKQNSPSKSPCHKRLKPADDNQKTIHGLGYSGDNVAGKMKTSRIPVSATTKSPKKILIDKMKLDIAEQIYIDIPPVAGCTNCTSDLSPSKICQDTAIPKLKLQDNNKSKFIRNPERVQKVNSTYYDIKRDKDCNKNHTEHHGKENSTSGFKTPSPVNSRISSKQNNNAFCDKTKSSAPKISFEVSSKSTPFTTPNFTGANSMKGTPPLCVCGRRSKRRLVQSPGPNLGRFFFSCGVKGDGNKSGCRFFQWESPASSRSTAVRHKSFTSHGYGKGISKPFTPVFNLTVDSATSVQRRQLGVRSLSYVRPPTCIR